MGRGMRPLSPHSGPVERFACELRALRALAGDQPFWKMARRCSVAKSALAAAAAGRRLPSQKVTREFVRACEGDWAYWQERWIQTAAELQAFRDEPGKSLVVRQPGVVEVVGSRPPIEAAAGDPWTPMDGDSSRREAASLPGRRWRLMAWTALAAIIVSVGYLWQEWPFRMGDSARGTAPVSDGTDPQVVGCGADVRNLATVPLRLRAPLTFRGQHLTKGTQIGTVTLRYSARCAGAWSRFDPAPVIDTDLKDSTAGSTTVWAQRPADSTQETWKMGHIDNAYSGILLTGVGCVVAGARIDVTNENMSAQGQTPCLPVLAGRH